MVVTRIENVVILSTHDGVRRNAHKELANGGREASLFYTSLCCRFRRACPGGSTTCGLGACQLNRCSRRDRPDGERDILRALVANQL